MAKTKPTNNSGKLILFFNDERVKLVIGIFSILISFYLLLSFFSFLFTWKADQSFEFLKVFSAASIEVDNWAGKSGAFFARLFISESFGVFSFLFIYLAVQYGLSWFNYKGVNLKKLTRQILTGVALGAILMGFLFGKTFGYLGSGLGGDYGYFISRWLISFLGYAGTGFLLILAIIIYLAVGFPKVFRIIRNRYLNNWFPNLITKDENPIDDDFEVENQEEEVVSLIEMEENFPGEEARKIDGLEIEETEDEFQVVNLNQNRPIENNEIVEKDHFEIADIKEEDLVRKNIVEELGEFDPTLELPRYKMPPLSLLEDHSHTNKRVSNEELVQNKEKIVETLGNYKIQIDKIKATIGPTVTLYEIVPAPGVRISKIKNLEDDIALSLAALGIRIIAPMPGKGTIGIEVPNQNPDIVSMLSILSSKRFQEAKFELPIALGKTISNETYMFDLTKMPHLLVAGATGQGKSVGLNAIITSLLYKKHPAQLKFVMVDPKKVELTLYSKIERHYLAKLPDSEEAIITDNQKVINTLNSLCIEMENRYKLLQDAYVRNIAEYNDKFIQRKLSPAKGHKYLPYIVVIVDEFADLIMTAGREVETPIARLAQLARAIGIHLIIATQRPTTNIITGVIKANFPARIAFRVTSGVDSKTILDTTGANQLIGRGDMLISQGNSLVRVQCAFIDIPELEHITEYIGSQQGYPDAFWLPEFSGDSTEGSSDVDLSKKDVMFEEAARLVVEHQQGSTSLIQRKFSIGYNRAGRIVDQLEAAGIVGQFEGSKARQVLYPDLTSLEQYLIELNKTHN